MTTPTIDRADSDPLLDSRNDAALPGSPLGRPGLPR
jgi:hypothetical protein